MTAGPRTLFGKVATLCGAGSGSREQTVFTPETILRVPRAIWGGIEYDCCTGPPGLVLNKAGRKAAKADKLPEDSDEWIGLGLAGPVQSQVNAKRQTTTDGLSAPWVDGTWVNPPYKTLAEWLEKSMAEAADHILLIPVRPNRKWWRAWARTAEIVYLNPVKFEGHDQSFPAPLCLARRNAPKPGQLDELCQLLGIGEAL